MRRWQRALAVVVIAPAVGLAGCSGGKELIQAKNSTPQVITFGSPVARATSAPTAAPTERPTRTPVPPADPLTVELAGVVQTKFTTYAGFVITNPNKEHYVVGSIVQVLVYDDGGAVVARVDQPVELVWPEQRTAGWVAVPRVDSSLKLGKAEARIRNSQALRAKVDPMLTADQTQFIPGTTNARVTGRINNPMDSDFGNVKVVAIIYDAAGNIVGGGDGKVEFVPKQGAGRADIKVEVTGSPARVELFPRLTAHSFNE